MFLALCLFPRAAVKAPFWNLELAEALAAEIIAADTMLIASKERILRGWNGDEIR